MTRARYFTTLTYLAFLLASVLQSSTQAFRIHAVPNPSLAPATPTQSEPAAEPVDLAPPVASAASVAALVVLASPAAPAEQAPTLRLVAASDEVPVTSAALVNPVAPTALATPTAPVALVATAAESEQAKTVAAAFMSSVAVAETSAAQSVASASFVDSPAALVTHGSSAEPAASTLLSASLKASGAGEAVAAGAVVAPGAVEAMELVGGAKTVVAASAEGGRTEAVNLPRTALAQLSQRAWSRELDWAGVARKAGHMAMTTNRAALPLFFGLCLVFLGVCCVSARAVEEGGGRGASRSHFGEARGVDSEGESHASQGPSWSGSHTGHAGARRKRERLKDWGLDIMEKANTAIRVVKSMPPHQPPYRGS